VVDLDDVVVGVEADSQLVSTVIQEGVAYNLPISEATTSMPFSRSCRPRPMAK
jgi:hypothetical protein